MFCNFVPERRVFHRVPQRKAEKLHQFMFFGNKFIWLYLRFVAFFAEIEYRPGAKGSSF
jgi:hypothetical protein